MGVDSNHRSNLQQIYSLSPLATREPIHMEHYPLTVSNYITFPPRLQEVFIRIFNPTISSRDDISFAGSVATADRLIRVMHRDAGIPLWQAVNMMTRNPAKALGEEEIGSLEPGKKADLVCFDENLQIRSVYRDGINVNR